MMRDVRSASSSILQKFSESALFLTRSPSFALPRHFSFRLIDCTIGNMLGAFGLSFQSLSSSKQCSAVRALRAVVFQSSCRSCHSARRASRFSSMRSIVSQSIYKDSRRLTRPSNLYYTPVATSKRLFSSTAPSWHGHLTPPKPGEEYATTQSSLQPALTFL